MFENFIKELKKVKHEGQITGDFAEEFTSLALAANMKSIENENPRFTPKEAFNIARLQVLNNFDNLLLSFTEVEEYYEE